MDTEQDPIAGVLTAVARILNRLNAPYFITGGVALLKWGHLRSTADIDLVVHLLPQKLSLLAKELLRIDKYSYVDEKAMREALETKGEFNFIHGTSGVKVDFWIQKGDDFSAGQMKRRIMEEVDGEVIYFCTPEDLILNKLLWHKENGSALQLEDVKSVLERQKNLDFDYINKWSKAHSISETLEALKQKL